VGNGQPRRQHTFIDESSVVKFIEYNWRLPRLGSGARRQGAGSFLSIFDFAEPKAPEIFLNPATGEVVSHMTVSGRLVRSGPLVH
jgi:phospholipase C